MQLLLLLLTLVAPPCVLEVQLADEVGQPVAARVVVRAAAGQMLAQQDAPGGEAALCGLPDEVVRVAVRGVLPDGIPLRQEGDDADGVRVALDSATGTQLALRVERDGTVIPDPALWASELGPLPTLPTPPATRPPTDLVRAGAPAAGTVGAMVGPPLCVLVLALVGGVWVTLYLRKRRTL